MPRKWLILGLPAILLHFGASLSSQGKSSSDVEALQALIESRSGLKVRLDDRGWEWREEDITGTRERGEALFSDRKWMMYLIHWGPIQRPKITLDYVQERMLKMWGVDFEFSGKSGVIDIAGHEAVWAEAYGTNRAFYSRFIIWNCPQSGRELIADTNYNLMLKTPAADFEDQMLSARTISCHDRAVPSKPPHLNQGFDSDKYRLSFFYPERWFVMDSPFYVPFPEYEGIRDGMTGSLLGLPSDQNITVIIKWSQAPEWKESALGMGVDRNVIESLQEEVRAVPGILEFTSRGQERFVVSGRPVHRIWGSYSAAGAGGDDISGVPQEGIFQAAQWPLESRQKKITVILRTRIFQYQGASSTPQRSSLDKFLRDLIRSIG